MTIISPIFPTQLPINISDPFERIVIKKLCNSLEYTKSLAEEIDMTRADFKIPEDSKEYGLSSNLCDALVGIHQRGKEKGLEINLSWSSALAVPQDISSNVVFPPKIMPTVARLGRRLRADVNRNFEFRGEVYGLQRQRRDLTGRVTLVGNVDNRERKIKVELTEHAYRTASIANQERKLVTCIGDLIKEGRVFTLSKPRGFAVVEDGEKRPIDNDLSSQLTIEDN